jgi:hypothetical protein
MNRTSQKIAISTSLLAAAAFSGLISGCKSSGSTDSGTQMNSADASKHACKGQNSCKGLGGCKTSDQGCKGKNSCKGNGGCNTIDPKM